MLISDLSSDVCSSDLITLISKDNFFLFTPMLHEVSSGMIETRHVASPLRAFCKRARLIESEVKSIDLETKRIIFTNTILYARIRNSIGEEQQRSNERRLGKECVSRCRSRC